jgi:hypothetical protein
MFKFRAWRIDRATGALTVEYKLTALAAKRAYLRYGREGESKTYGWETRGHWAESLGDAGVKWAA